MQRDANICNGYLQNINITTETETETEIPSHSRSITSIQPNRGLISNKICMNVKKSSFDIFCDKKNAISVKLIDYLPMQM